MNVDNFQIYVSLKTAFITSALTNLSFNLLSIRHFNYLLSTFCSRSNTLQKKRPSWCQDLPTTTTTTGEEGGGEGVGWSPRGRSLDLRGVSSWGLSTVEEGAECQPLTTVLERNIPALDNREAVKLLQQEQD